MMEFSGLVWAVPLLLFIGVIITFTFNSSDKTMRLNISLAILAFIISLLVTIERYFKESLDYGYYVDWFVVDHFYYRIGYEVNHTSAFFLIIITGINLINLLLALQLKHTKKNSTYGYLNLIGALLAGIVLSDNVLTYYILSFCLSVAVFLKLANLNVVGMLHTLRAYSKTFIIGHLIFLCALMLIFYHQPNHAVEFTVIDSSLSIQPDLLLMDNEGIIGLLLVLSTIFISTVLVPFEKQFRENPKDHLVTIYTLTFVRIVIPAYMLIRFESLIRIDPFIESCVIILGVALLIISCLKMIRQLTIADILLNMSNAMLGMIYMMYGLQAKLMLSALVLIYLSVFLLMLVLVIANQRYILYVLTKVLTSIILLLPFIMCISASNFYSLNIAMPVTYLNLMIWIGIVVYSLTVFMSIMGLRRDKLNDIGMELKGHKVINTMMVIVVFTLILAVSFSWHDQFMAVERAKFAITFNMQLGINLIILLGCILIGLLTTLMIKKSKRYYRPLSEVQAGHEFNYISPIKAASVNVIYRIETFWNHLFEYKLPYLFKKSEAYMSQLITSNVTKIIIVWVVGVVIALILVIIRG